MAYCITKILGMERIKAGVPRWMEALAAGKAAAPKCDARTRSGPPCRQGRMVGGDRCRLHLNGPQRDKLDLQRAKLAMKRSLSTNVRFREEAAFTLAGIARRQLHRHWKLDPTLPGSTLDLTEADEKRVAKWLLEHGVVLGPDISARATDRLRWAATLALGNRITAESARRRVGVALRDDAAWFAKHGERA